MSENLLQRGERTTGLKPPTRERVPELLRVEVPDTRPAYHLLGEPTWMRERADSPDVFPKFLQKRRGQVR